MKLNKKAFFVLFPIGYWIVLVLGIVFHYLTEAFQLGNVLINLAVLLLAFKAAVIIHEAGHLIAAKAVGGTPRRMVLGRGHELFRAKLFNVTIVINSTFLGGHAYASFGQPGSLKLRYGAFILGGILLNVTFAFFMYAFFEMAFIDRARKVVIAVPYAIFLTNAVMVLNLIPYYATIMGMKVPTDGLALLKLPFTKLGEIEKRIDINLLLDGHEFMEKKDYESAWNVFNEYLKKYPDAKILSMNISLILLKTGRTEEGLNECLKLLNHLEDQQIKRFTGLIYNQIAWICLVLNDISQADHYSALAIKAIPNENYIRGTRGSVLIENGSINEGMTLLFHNMDFKFVNNATLSSAIYLMLAYHIRGDVAERNKYLQFIRTNDDRLDKDERILYERNLKQIESKEIVKII
jgi:tetratricopeptide (TPR) repeat protein